MLNFILLFLSFFFVSTVAAQSNSQIISDCSMEDIAPIFCESMNNEAFYDQNKFSSYKMLVPGDDGWIFRSESDFRSDFSLSGQALNKMEELNEALKNRGIELVVLITPTRGLIHYDHIKAEDKKKYKMTAIDDAWKSYRLSIKTIKNRGIHVLGVERPSNTQDFFYKRDHHWNPTGAYLSAQAVANYIKKKIPAYKSIERVQYATKMDGIYDFYGVSKKVFKKLCDTKQPPEQIVKKITERINASSAQDDLFGDVKNPEIVLLGTSNSTMEPSFANFEGFLKQELSSDIINMSVSGGGMDTAMISYLNSDFLKNSPAKIAIWEIPGYYNISNQNNFFREAIPAALGSCDGTELAGVKDVLIEDPSVLALDNLAQNKITGDDYYFNINFEKPLAKPFTLDLRYIKNRDKYKFQRPGRYPADGQFFVSLQENKKEYLDKVVLTLPPEAMNNRISVQLCKKEKESSQAFWEPKQFMNVNGLINLNHGEIKQ